MTTIAGPRHRLPRTRHAQNVSTRALPRTVDAVPILAVNTVTVTIAGRSVLENVSFSAAKGSLTAVIGPSGAGKTTLARVIAGAMTPTSGSVAFHGHSVAANFASLRHEIGLVPQDDVVHGKLTVQQALRFAAELRLARESKAARAEAIASVLDELELGELTDIRIDALSGGQRKRVSVAIELLTRPSLLILDEPTSGLDPALDRHLMAGLRRLATADRAVVVITHCLTHLDLCDQVLVLAPGGRMAYVGRPEDVFDDFGSDCWADVFTSLTSDPDRERRCLAGRPDEPAPPDTDTVVAPLPSVRNRLIAQSLLMCRRQWRLTIADRGYLYFLMALPVILGGLTLVVPGSSGFGRATVDGGAPNEPAQILLLLNTSVVFLGIALTVREIVAEKAIFRREQAVGLSATAYLIGKIVVAAGFVSAQTAVVLGMALFGKGRPATAGAVVPSASWELLVSLAATAIVSCVLGLAISTIARSQEQVLPAFVMTMMISIVFSGGMIPVTGRMILEQVSWLVPARWGFSAGASTVDLRAIAPLVPADESLWTHSGASWLLSMAVLGCLGLLLACVVRWRIRLSRRFD
ncbi:ABC transporter ATP-binding protein/permease [Mycolicibacterium vaccae]|uniref:ABC transporter ATP-binding protein/permease n=1 Tax=Mycolicibacterium vaccae TaxID=1810 RepID=UPI003CF90354